MTSKLFSFVTIVLACSLAAGDDVIEIGSRLELFVDDYLIDSTSDVRLVLQHPTIREVAIDHNEPWEGNICGGHTVLPSGRDVFGNLGDCLHEAGNVFAPTLCFDDRIAASVILLRPRRHGILFKV